MHTPPRAASPVTGRFGVSAFTLIELLVVISIIAVLAGILLPVTSSVIDNAHKTEAKSTEMQIVTAIKSFQTDYGVYPNPTASQQDVTWGGGGTDNAGLFAILRATDTAASSVNTRRVVYFEGKDVKNAGKPKSGFAIQPGTTTIVNKAGNATGSYSVGTLVDPWGIGYMVRYDSGYDDQVMLPELEGNTPGNKDSSGQSSGVLRTGVIAWSYGKDGLAGNGGDFGKAPSYTYGDDVVSWQ